MPEGRFVPDDWIEARAAGGVARIARPPRRTGLGAEADRAAPDRCRRSARDARMPVQAGPKAHSTHLPVRPVLDASFLAPHPPLPSSRPPRHGPALALQELRATLTRRTGTACHRVRNPPSRFDRVAQEGRRLEKVRHRRRGQHLHVDGRSLVGSGSGVLRSLAIRGVRTDGGAEDSQARTTRSDHYPETLLTVIVRLRLSS